MELLSVIGKDCDVDDQAGVSIKAYAGFADECGICRGANRP
jgi:hypothetical protein